MAGFHSGGRLRFTSLILRRLLCLQSPHGPRQKGAWIQCNGIYGDWGPSSVAAFIRLQCHCDLWCHPPPLPPLRYLDGTLSATSPSTLLSWVTLPGANKPPTALFLGSLEHTHTEKHTHARAHACMHRQPLTGTVRRERRRRQCCFFLFRSYFTSYFTIFVSNLVIYWLEQLCSPPCSLVPIPP